MNRVSDGAPPRSAAVDLPGPLRGAFIAGLTGAAALGLELTAARLFMPWFGASIHVWSKVIGVALAALALGNLAGGRLAARWPSRFVLGGLLGAAAATAALAPLLTRAFALSTVPADLPLEAALGILGQASLVTAIAALGLPLFVLGTIFPFVVKGAARTWSVERSSGVLSSVSTFGGLLGTFAPVHWTIPSYGSRATCLGIAAVLAIAAFVAAWPLRARHGLAAAAVASILGAAIASFAPTPWKPQSGDGTVVLERESAYQYVRVERARDATRLCLNEGLDSYHSLAYAGDVMTRGAYYDSLSLMSARPLTASPSPRVLVLGFAAGTVARQLLALFGEHRDLRIDGVELDPVVAELAGPYFELPPDPRITIHVDVDARSVLDRTNVRYDVIVVDAYAQQIHVPFQLCSREFFASVREHLAPGGLFLANVSAFSADDGALRAIARTACAEFTHVGALAVFGSRNFVLAGSMESSTDQWLLPPTTLPERLHPARSAADEARGVFAWPTRPDDVVLTDDRSPVERIMEHDLELRARALLAAGRGAR
ncbi:MAG: fused MFS/spermidine synthase [Planctomycetes bacterium]|nr:fused MFS/spermidine synthase [Planctomycetota bacterium]MCC7170670.1 fused MFS/spermidine synthase [Planctomycetota bacterium]